MTAPSFRLLLSGLDTVQAAYYLVATRTTFSFDRLMEEKERLRAGGTRDPKVVEIGEWTFVLRPYGSGSGYPLVLEHPHFTMECGKHNSPGFFVTFRSQALWEHGALALHDAFLKWADAVDLVPNRMEAESLSRVDFSFDYSLPAIDF